MSHPDPNLIALGVRQPWAELILRGIKTVEVRSQDTNVRGPIYVYAAKQAADTDAAREAARAHRLDVAELPRGVLVGTVEIERSGPALAEHATPACVPPEVLDGRYGWHLRRPERLETPLAVRFLPYGVWFYPFKRRNGGVSRRSS